MSGNIRFVGSYLLASFGHVQNFGQMPCGMGYAVCPVLLPFVWFSCVQHSEGILYVSVDVCST